MRLFRGLLCVLVFVGGVCFPAIAYAADLASEIQVFQGNTNDLFQQAKALLSRYQNNLAFRNQLHAQPVSEQRKDWDKTLARLLDQTDRSMQELVRLFTLAGELQDAALAPFETDSAKRLVSLKTHFAQTLEKFRGSSEILQSNQKRSNDAFYDRLGPWLAPVINAHLIEGGGSETLVVNLIESFAATPLLMHSRLVLSQVVASVLFLQEELMGLGFEDRQWLLPRTSQANYESLRVDMQIEFRRLQTLFPELPSIERGELNSGEGRKKIDRVLSHFEKNFSSQRERVRKALKQLIQAYVEVQSFSTQAFPNLNAEEQSIRLSTELNATPELAECSSLGHAVEGKGFLLSNILEGPSCDLTQFPKALKEYIGFHEKQAGYGILPIVLEAIGSAEAKLKTKELTWKDVENRIEASLGRLSDLNEQTLPAWSKLKPALFSEPSELEKRLGNGIELHDYLALKFQQAGVDPLLGLDTSFMPSLYAARNELQTFERAIPKAVKKIERLSSTSDCRPFDTASVSDSPYVVWTEKLVPVSREGDRSTTTLPSTQGFQRLLWGHKVRLANAVNLPRSPEPEKLLAGSLKWTALSRYLPNLVLLRLFNGAPLKENLTLADLGVRENSIEFGFSKLKGAPAWEKILAESRQAFSVMLEDFQSNNASLFPEATALGENKVRELFRSRYRDELYLAAKEMRRWGEEFELLTNGNTSEQRYQAIQAAPVGELCTLFQLSPQYCNSALERGLQMSLMRDLFPKIKENYFRRHPGLNKHVSFTPQMFQEELVMHKGVIGGDAPVPGLTSEEIQRYKTYLGYIPEEQYRAWAYRISSLQKVYEHTQNTLERRRSTLQSMRSMLLHLFPPLRMELAKPGSKNAEPVWKWFQGNAEQLNVVMEAYAEEAADLINELQGLESEKEVLDFTLPILPLVDQTLRFFPENKASVCSEYAARNFWKNAESGSLAAVEFAGAAAMGLGPVGVAVGAGVFAVALTVDYMRLQQQSAELARNKAHELASWSQVSLATSSEATALVEGLDRAYSADAAAFYLRAGLTASFVGAAAIKNLGLFGRIPGALAQGNEAYIAGVRAGVGLPSMPAEGAWKYWSRFAGRVTRVALKRDGKAWNRLLRPLVRQGFISSTWPHMTLAERWADPLLTSNRWWIAKPLVNRTWGVARWGVDVLYDMPASFLGRSFGPGVIGAAATSSRDVMILASVVGFFNKTWHTNWNELAWEDLQDNAKLYEPLLLRVLNGELSPDALSALVYADQEYRKIWEGALRKIPVTDDYASKVLELRNLAEADLNRAGDNEKYSYPQRQAIKELDVLLRAIESSQGDFNMRDIRRGPPVISDRSD